MADETDSEIGITPTKNELDVKQLGLVAAIVSLGYVFWVVGATGLVLYAFFDTSVEGAYRSVEAITRGGFGLGSIMRTVHRHASDAMLLTMLIHLAVPDLPDMCVLLGMYQLTADS